jgi:hypothetical protein
VTSGAGEAIRGLVNSVKRCGWAMSERGGARDEKGWSNKLVVRTVVLEYREAWLV